MADDRSLRRKGLDVSIRVSRNIVAGAPRVHQLTFVETILLVWVIEGLDLTAVTGD